jgi:PKD domain
MAVRSLALAFVVLMLMSAVAVGDEDPQGGADIVETPDGDGVSASSGLGYQVTEGPGRDETSAANLGSNQVPVPTGLIPHSCVPVFNGGIDLDYVFSPAGGADCASFISPAASQPSEPGPPIGPSPEQLAAIAADEAMSLAESPELEIAPGSIGLTGLDSYFWLDHEPRPVVATAEAPGLSVTAEAHPIQYVWRFGDGAERRTGHPGRRWTRRRPGNIAHMYETRGRYTVEVEVVWEARWRIGGGAWMPLGYFTNSDSSRYPVREVRSALTRDR